MRGETARGKGLNRLVGLRNTVRNASVARRFRQRRNAFRSCVYRGCRERGRAITSAKNTTATRGPRGAQRATKATSTLHTRTPIQVTDFRDRTPTLTRWHFSPSAGNLRLLVLLSIRNARRRGYIETKHTHNGQVNRDQTSGEARARSSRAACRSGAGPAGTAQR